MNNSMMIRGCYPGTGKSYIYIYQKMVDKGYNVIVVTPTNKLLQAFEGEAMTINKLFGINYADAKLEPFEFTGYDVIVFDEIYFSSLSTYWQIKQCTPRKMQAQQKCHSNRRHQTITTSSTNNKHPRL